MSAALDALLDELCREINDAAFSGGDAAAPMAWADARFLTWAERIAAFQAGARPDLHPPPGAVRRLADLPPTTTDAFRYAAVRCFEGEAVATFATSGTLAGIRGRHALARTDVYSVSALHGFDLLVPGADRLRHLISLIPPAATLPESSLSWMLALFAEVRFDGRTTWAAVEGEVDVDRVARALADATGRGEPVLLFTTTLAAAALLESNVAGPLPAGSIILTTGGAKGQRTSVDAGTVEAELARRFPGAAVGAEFGMTELLSQAYRMGTRPFRLPPWCRVLAVDPDSGERCRHGEPGLLRFVDLANVQSALTVQTADRGITHSDHTFTLLGRALGAPLRGCSLTYEELAAGEPVPVRETSALRETSGEPELSVSPEVPRSTEVSRALQPAEILSALAALRGELTPTSPLTSAVAAESGLHPQSLSTWLREWCTSIDAAALERLLSTTTRPRGSARVLTLAPGNVPVVAAECLILGLLAGVPHTLALSTRGRALPQALLAHLSAASPTPLPVELVVWRELSPRDRARLLADRDRVVAYGTAETVEWLAAQVPPGTAIVPHGPSLAGGTIRPSAVTAEGLREALHLFAQDVAAYDQRGCRSPHFLLVDGTHAEALRSAEWLAAELTALETQTPRGPQTEAERTVGFLDRLSSRSLGRSWPAPHSAVSLELAPAALRPSPLGRTVRVVRLDPAALPRLLATLPAPLGLLGTPDASRPPGAWPDALEIQAMGTLQRAPFDRLHDGRHRLDELLSPSP